MMESKNNNAKIYPDSMATSGDIELKDIQTPGVSKLNETEKVRAISDDIELRDMQTASVSKLDETEQNLNNNLNESTLVEVPLSDNAQQMKKKPKQVLYFSDGPLEIYSSDEEDDNEDTRDSVTENPVTDVKNLSWGPFLAHMAGRAGSRTLSACDYLGENLAYYLGITSPKYQYEIDEHEKIEKRKSSMISGQSSQEGNENLSNVHIDKVPSSDDASKTDDTVSSTEKPVDQSKNSEHWERY